MFTVAIVGGVKLLTGMPARPRASSPDTALTGFCEFPSL